MRAARAAAIAIALVAAGGCRAVVELVESDPAAEVDAAGPDPGCQPWSFAPATLDPCALPAPGPALTLTAGTWGYDTNSGALTDPAQDVTFPPSALVMPAGGPELRAVSIARFDVGPGAVLRVSGKRPLVVVAWSDAAIAGAVDVTSRSGAPAAGADPDACAATAAAGGTANPEGAGGGGGGGLGAAGAAGGAGVDGAAGGGDGGGSAATPVGVRGGCAGAAGGNALAGAGGPGGGALVIAARDRVQLDGVIAAGGAGGGAAQGGRGGGGGGGAGGVVVLAAPAIAIGAGAVIAANGGGGGGGSDGNPALAGRDGQPSAAAAAGGQGQGMGGDGGAGGAAATGALVGLRARRGGGGGGGAVGRIALDSPAISVDPAAIISPAPR